MDKPSEYSDLSLEEALKKYPRDWGRDSVEQAEKEREEMLARFPREAWKSMRLEDYALGLPDSENSFCRWLEFKTPHLGSVKGGSARKLLIFKKKNEPGWFFDKDYSSEQGAWQAVREGFLEAFSLADEGKWDEIDAIEALSKGPSLRLKTLYIHFPQDLLPVYSLPHLKHFLSRIDDEEWKGRAYNVVHLNRTLLQRLRQFAPAKSWTTKELERFLYWWDDPRSSATILKIAPGENARFWDDCRKGGYICVGWDEVGDLREYESKEAFRQAFEQAYRDEYSGNRGIITRKSNELWRLSELAPGDIIVANQGKSKVLAVGSVIEPGYEWSEERAEYRHLVRVDWHTPLDRTIPSQGAWGVTTIAPVSGTLYRQIVEGAEASATGSGMAPIPPVFSSIEDALENKKQVILYGPPGCGKTYRARQFASWWLLRKAKPDDAASVLSHQDKAKQHEAALTKPKSSKRVWWIVANPKEWAWDQLFKDKTVQYRYGRLKANYARVQAGDLVVGYQATPDKKIVAIAEVARGLHDTKQGPKIALKPVAKVANGIAYDELLSDPVMKGSEPMRFNNQGTLFALTPEEAEDLFSQLVEKNPDLVRYLPETGRGVAQLTWTTFHPSYTYEDFIEGYKPTRSSDNTLNLALQDGIFKKICIEAKANPKAPYLLLIDELNRGNVPKIFGELITLLESDKREMSITLPQSKESFEIPPNVYIIGTMNTADRSLKLLDAAIRRRFGFIEFLPDYSILTGASVGNLALDAFLEQLNDAVLKEEGREKQIGHSYLLNSDGTPVTDLDEFARRFRQELLPLLQEYCYEDYGVLAKLLGEKIVDVEAQVISDDIVFDPDSLIAALEDKFGQGSQE